jgi:hypothetical protein
MALLDSRLSSTEDRVAGIVSYLKENPKSTSNNSSTQDQGNTTGNSRSEHILDTSSWLNIPVNQEKAIKQDFKEDISKDKIGGVNKDLLNLDFLEHSLPPTVGRDEGQSAQGPEEPFLISTKYSSDITRTVANILSARNSQPGSTNNSAKSLQPTSVPIFEHKGEIVEDGDEDGDDDADDNDDENDDDDDDDDEQDRFNFEWDDSRLMKGVEDVIVEDKEGEEEDEEHYADI